MVADLRTLLRRAGIDGPYIVVGHSFGGLLATRYAYRYRSEVAAIVLVDAMHDDQFTLFAPHFPPASPGDSPQLASLRAFWTSGWRDPRATTEGIDFVASLEQGRQVESLDELPVRVVSAGTFLAMPGVPPHKRACLQALWDSLQASHARLSADVAHTRIAASGHFVQRDRPEAVVAAVEGLVAQRAAGKRGSTVDPLYAPRNR
jgi:pimeloyl-ACP methyl ester carboxylesterase